MVGADQHAGDAVRPQIGVLVRLRQDGDAGAVLGEGEVGVDGRQGKAVNGGAVVAGALAAVLGVLEGQGVAAGFEQELERLVRTAAREGVELGGAVQDAQEVTVVLAAHGVGELDVDAGRALDVEDVGRSAAVVLVGAGDGASHDGVVPGIGCVVGGTDEGHALAYGREAGHGAVCQGHESRAERQDKKGKDFFHSRLLLYFVMICFLFFSRTKI